MDIDQAVTRNLSACLVTLIFVKAVVGICDYLVSKDLLPMLVSRKIVHLAATCWCLFWPMFDTSDETWKLNIVVPTMYGIQLIYKGLILRDPKDHDVKTMSRTGNPIELCNGPLMFVFCMIYCGLFQFRTSTGTYIMAAVGFGDGVAPLFGKLFPFGAYPTFQGTKTLSGSFGMFISTVFGILVLRHGLGTPATLEWPRIFAISLFTTIVEGLTGKFDNAFIPIAVISLQKATTVNPI